MLNEIKNKIKDKFYFIITEINFVMDVSMTTLWH